MYSRLSCAAPEGAGAVDVQQLVLDPPGSLKAPAEEPEPKDPSKMEGEKSPAGCCTKNQQVSQHMKSFDHDLIYKLCVAGIIPRMKF